MAGTHNSLSVLYFRSHTYFQFIMYQIVIWSFLKKIFPYSFLTCKHALLVLSCFALICISGMMQAQTGVLAKKAMVVTAHPEATDVGIRILQKGGNAVDAAVAVQFALAVVYPNAGNIGGGGFMVYRNVRGETATLDFREKAPLKATRNMYLDTAGDPITDLSLSGALAVGVPGTVDGMVKAHERFGALPWKDVVEPAIALASRGFLLTKKQADELNAFRPQFTKWNPDSTTPFIRDSLWHEGDILIQKDLAKTLRRIRTYGRKGFYSGTTADMIVDEMKRASNNVKGIITKKDLELYSAQWRDALVGEYNGYKVITMSPPSSGGVALLQLLTMWNAHKPKQAVFHSADAVHCMVECERRVYADRAKWLGDPDCTKVPIRGLLKPAYLQQRMENFNPLRATHSTDCNAGDAGAYESEETTHFSIVDEQGNAVAITTTLNASYGSKLVVGGAGFLLNNEMDDFSAKPGASNFYGLIGSEANAIQPQKRMLSSMTPTILEKDGKLFMVVGTPGGGTIITSVFQCILNVVDFGKTMQQAVNEKRFHHQWLPDHIFEEEYCFDTETGRELSARGHKFKQREAIGRVDAILVKSDGTLEGAADPRGDDTAKGY